MNTNNKKSSSEENLMRFGYSGILQDLEILANNQPSYLHLSECDPPVYNYLLDKGILKKINNRELPPGHIWLTRGRKVYSGRG